MSPQQLADMFSLMETIGGVGLAAPQCSLDYKVAVIQHDGNRYVLNEPVLLRSNGATLDIEGCLSLPGQSYWVVRQDNIVVQTKAGKMRASGLLARIIQHETDHLNGVLISDIGIKEDYGMT